MWVVVFTSEESYVGSSDYYTTIDKVVGPFATKELAKNYLLKKEWVSCFPHDYLWEKVEESGSLSADIVLVNQPD